MYTATVSVPGNAGGTQAPLSIRTLVNTAVPGLIPATSNGRVLSVSLLTGATTTAEVVGLNSVAVGNSPVQLPSNATTVITAFNQNQVSVDEIFLYNTSSAVAVSVGVIIVVV